MKYHHFKHKALTLIHKYEIILNNKTHLFKIVHGQNPEHEGIFKFNIEQIPCHLLNLTDAYNHTKSPLFMLERKNSTSACLVFGKTFSA